MSVEPAAPRGVGSSRTQPEEDAEDYAVQYRSLAEGEAAELEEGQTGDVMTEEIALGAEEPKQVVLSQTRRLSADKEKTIGTSRQSTRNWSYAGERVGQRMQQMWRHPAGLQTIFFWAPTTKWLLVLAGIADVHRPASEISLPQTIALTVSCIVWIRYSFAIQPVNYNLAAVNVFVALIGVYQLQVKIRGMVGWG